MATDEKNVPTNPSEISRPSFPTNPEDFDADDRISFSKLDNKFILEADDGQEFEFDDALKRWVPAVCPLKLSHHHHHHPWTVLMQPLLADGESNDVPYVACPLYSWTTPCWSSKDKHMPSRAWTKVNPPSRRRKNASRNTSTEKM